MKKRKKLNLRQPELIDSVVANRLRALRMLAGLSQTDLAITLGLSFQQVQKYENGTNRISASKLYCLAKVLRVPVSNFFCGQDGLGLDDDYGNSALTVSLNADADSQLHSREALVLVRNYQRIKDDRIRSELKALILALAGVYIA